MLVSLDSLGKKFNQNWIFKNLSSRFSVGESVAIVGPNGSGKSTLLQIISGLLPPTKGTVTYEQEGQPIDGDDIYKHLSLVTPVMELIEEFTLGEFLKFHFKLKAPAVGADLEELLSSAKIDGHKSKYLKNFSTGMKQRLKLILAFAAAGDLVLLDEPTTNLDEQGKEWYLQNIQQLKAQKLLFIASNQSHEHDFCDKALSLLDFK